MVAEWFSAAVTAIYTVVTLVNTDGEPIQCPQLGHIVSAAFAFGGHSINPTLVGGTESDKKYQHQLVIESLARLRNSFVSINGTVLANGRIAKELGRSLSRTKAETLLVLHEIETVLSDGNDHLKMMKPVQDALAEFDHVFGNAIAKYNGKTNIEGKLEKVWYRMVRAITSRKESDIESFKSKYASSPPLATLKKFALGLKDPSTSPIAAAMEANALDSRMVLERYRQLFSTMIVRVLALEGFNCGLADVSKNETVPCLEKVTKSVEEAATGFRDYALSYKMNEELYWPNLVQAVMDAHIDETDVSDIADSVHRQLESIHTTDVFSIYAWFDISGEQSYPVHTPDEVGTPRYLQKWVWDSTPDKRSKYLVVLRSRTFHEVSRKSFDLERIAYRAYAVTEEMVYDFHGLKHKYEQLNALLAHFRGQDKRSPPLPPIHGFAVFNATPVVRFTNNGFSILTEEDQLITRAPRVYNGISWN